MELKHSDQLMTKYSFSKVIEKSVLAVGVSALFGACSLGSLVDGAELPADIIDSEVLKTVSGATALYNSAIIGFSNSVGGKAMFDSTDVRNSQNNAGSVIFVTGLFTDELHSAESQEATSSLLLPVTSNAVIDARSLPDNIFTADYRGRTGQYRQLYGNLQKIRARATDARGVFRKYHSGSFDNEIGHLFALEGMAIVLLAEIFCSGIPLSTFDFEGDYAPKAGLNTQQLFEHSLTLFDSAKSYISDSVNFEHLASIGKARAYLGLANYSAASTEVGGIPTDWVYRVGYSTNRPNLFHTVGNMWSASVADTEGNNGLDFISSGDPRTAVDTIVGHPGNPQPRVPRKYVPAGSPPGTNPGTMALPFASGIEARLIQAEASLSSGGASWLATLNELRTTCLPGAICNAPEPAGSGNVAGLPLLVNPASDSAKVDLLFRERAFWLFLTGHRFGDMRRMIRQYNFREEALYPSGVWGYNRFGSYGNDVSLPVPVEEQETNGLYTGCFNRDA